MYNNYLFSLYYDTYLYMRYFEKKKSYSKEIW